MAKVKKKRQLKDVTVTHVSYVRRGVNKKQFFLAKSICDRAEVEFPVRFFAKQDEESEKKLLYGVVYEPDLEDACGDVMTSDEIEKTAHEFLQFYRNIDTEHNLLAGAGVVVESYIAPVNFNIGGNEIKAGSWVLVTKANDEIWEAWKNGDITGYSMFGISRETQVSKGEPIMKSWIKKMLDAVGLSKSFDEVMANTIDKMSTNPFFIMDIMREDFFNNISWDSANEEQLTALSASMKSAVEYIDKKIASLASPEQQPETEPVSKSVPVAVVEPPAEPTKPDQSNEPAAEPEPEPEQPVVEVIKSMGTEFLQAVKDMESRFDGKIAELSKAIADTNNKLNDKLTNSAVSIPASVVAQRASRPRGSGLV